MWWPFGGKSANYDAPAPEKPLAEGLDFAPGDGSRFVLERRLGRGAVGEVWQAKRFSAKSASDFAFTEPIAVKFLQSEFLREFTASLGGQAKERFIREAQRGLGLKHPNLVETLFTGAQYGYDYLAMEFCDQGSLLDFLGTLGKQPTIEARLAIVLELLRALEYLHGQGVVHRDIKPQNILFREGRARLCDFGFAKWTTFQGNRPPDSADSRPPNPGGGSRGAPDRPGFGEDAEAALTMTGDMIGSMGYVAPEQAEDAKHIDQRADFYPVGMVLYEIFCWKTISPDQVRKGRDTPIEDAFPYPGMLGVFRKLAAFDPKARFTRASEAIERLERWQARARLAEAWLAKNKLRADEAWEDFCEGPPCKACGQGPIVATRDEDPDLRFRRCAGCGKEQ